MTESHWHYPYHSGEVTAVSARLLEDELWRVLREGSDAQCDGLDPSSPYVLPLRSGGVLYGQIRAWLGRPRIGIDSVDTSTISPNSDGRLESVPVQGLRLTLELPITKCWLLLRVPSQMSVSAILATGDPMGALASLSTEAQKAALLDDQLKFELGTPSLYASIVLAPMADRVLYVGRSRASVAAAWTSPALERDGFYAMLRYDSLSSLFQRMVEQLRRVLLSPLIPVAGALFQASSATAFKRDVFERELGNRLALGDTATNSSIGGPRDLLNQAEAFTEFAIGNQLDTPTSCQVVHRLCDRIVLRLPRQPASATTGPPRADVTSDAIDARFLLDADPVAAALAWERLESDVHQAMQARLEPLGALSLLPSWLRQLMDGSELARDLLRHTDDAAIGTNRVAASVALLFHELFDVDAATEPFLVSSAARERVRDALDEFRTPTQAEAFGVSLYGRVRGYLEDGSFVRDVLIPVARAGAAGIATVEILWLYDVVRNAIDAALVGNEEVTGDVRTKVIDALVLQIKDMDPEAIAGLPATSRIVSSFSRVLADHVVGLIPTGARLGVLPAAYVPDVGADLALLGRTLKIDSASSPFAAPPPPTTYSPPVPLGPGPVGQRGNAARAYSWGYLYHVLIGGLQDALLTTCGPENVPLAGMLGGPVPMHPNDTAIRKGSIPLGTAFWNAENLDATGRISLLPLLRQLGVVTSDGSVDFSAKIGGASLGTSTVVSGARVNRAEVVSSSVVIHPGRQPYVGLKSTTAAISEEVAFPQVDVAFVLELDLTVYLAEAFVKQFIDAAFRAASVPVVGWVIAGFMAAWVHKLRSLDGSRLHCTVHNIGLAVRPTIGPDGRVAVTVDGRALPIWVEWFDDSDDGKFPSQFPVGSVLRGILRGLFVNAARVASPNVDTINTINEYVDWWTLLDVTPDGRLRALGQHTVDTEIRADLESVLVPVGPYVALEELGFNEKDPDAPCRHRGEAELRATWNALGLLGTPQLRTLFEPLPGAGTAASLARFWKVRDAYVKDAQGRHPDAAEQLVAVGTDGYHVLPLDPDDGAASGSLPTLRLGPLSEYSGPNAMLKQWRADLVAELSAYRGANELASWMLNLNQPSDAALLAINAGVGPVFPKTWVVSAPVKGYGAFDPGVLYGANGTRFLGISTTGASAPYAEYTPFKAVTRDVIERMLGPTELGAVPAMAMQDPGITDLALDRPTVVGVFPDRSYFKLQVTGLDLLRPVPGGGCAAVEARVTRYPRPAELVRPGPTFKTKEWFRSYPFLPFVDHLVLVDASWQLTGKQTVIGVEMQVPPPGEELAAIGPSTDLRYRFSLEYLPDRWMLFEGSCEPSFGAPFPVSQVFGTASVRASFKSFGVFSFWDRLVDVAVVTRFPVNEDGTLGPGRPALRIGFEMAALLASRPIRVGMQLTGEDAFGSWTYVGLVAPYGGAKQFKFRVALQVWAASDPASALSPATSLLEFDEVVHSEVTDAILVAGDPGAVFIPWA